jgi:hypothetical protein
MCQYLIGPIGWSQKAGYVINENKLEKRHFPESAENAFKARERG